MYLINNIVHIYIYIYTDMYKSYLSHFNLNPFGVHGIFEQCVVYLTGSGISDIILPKNEDDVDDKVQRWLQDSQNESPGM